MWHPWLGTVGTQTFAPGAAELGLGCAQNCLGTARGPGPAEATQRELYLHAKRVVHDRVNFIPGEIFFPLRPGLLSLGLKRGTIISPLALLSTRFSL